MMSKHNETRQDTKEEQSASPMTEGGTEGDCGSGTKTDHDRKVESVAERYLELWQDNIQRWATDPDTLEKWIAELKTQKDEP